MFEVKIKTQHEDAWPIRAHASDAGADLRSMEDVIIYPGEAKLINTGVAVKIPLGFVGMIFNRSSQGKRNIQIANGTGIIDADYRGNIYVLLRNNGNMEYVINSLDTRIAQLVIVPIMLPEFVEHLESELWDDTARGTGGFGSTGT